MSAAQSTAVPTADRALRRLRVAEFERMIEAGVFEEDERIELVDGVLVSYAPPQGDCHSWLIWELFEMIRAALGERAVLRAQSPVVIADVTRLEPDIAIMRPPATAYRAAPRAGDLFAVIEVADSSIRFDRVRKLRLYAAAGVPEYWIVNVRAQRLEIHRDPNGAAYETRILAERGTTVSLGAFPDAVFSVDELFA